MPKSKTFNADDEIGYYEAGAALPPSDQELDKLAADMRFWVPEFPAFFQGKQVLDLGAGTASVGTLIAQRFAPERVVSLELVMHRLRAAKTWVQRLPSLNLVCGDIFALPFEGETFDLVVANSVLHHLPDVARATAEIARVLRPGGFYIGREPNFNNPLIRLYVFKWISHSANEYSLRAQEIIAAFSKAGCHCEMHYFWRRLRTLRHPIFSAAISVRAERL